MTGCLESARVEVLGLPRSSADSTDRLKTWEGVYCPSQRDKSGRLEYAQHSSFKSPGTSELRGKFSFDLTSGQWCLAGEGCAASEAADPVDVNSPLLAETWEAVAVTDFDGQFGAAPSAGRHPIQFPKHSALRGSCF